MGVLTGADKTDVLILEKARKNTAIKVVEKRMLNEE
jgi:hypothetical protein